MCYNDLSSVRLAEVELLQGALGYMNCRPPGQTVFDAKVCSGGLFMLVISADLRYAFSKEKGCNNGKTL